MGKTIDDATKAKAVADFLAKRKTAKEIGDELQVTPTAVRNWSREAASRVLESSGATKVETAPVPAPIPHPMGSVQGGGLDAARRAAGLPSKEKPSPLDAPDGAKPTVEGGPPPINADDAVGLAEMAVFLATRGYCAANGIDMTEETERLCQLTDRERSHLRSVAPYAGKYLAYILAKFDMIGFALFMGGFVMVLATRISKLKPLKKKKVEEPEGGQA